MQNALFVIPPEGAARHYALQIIESANSMAPGQNKSVHTWDSGKWQHLYHTLLQPAESDPKAKVFEPLGLLNDFLGQALLAKVVDLQATEVWVFALAPINRYWIKLIKQAGARTIHWFYEDARMASYWKDVCMEYDVFAGIQGDVLAKEVQQHGGTFASIQNAANQATVAAIRPMNTQEWDASFVGVWSEYRQKCMETLCAQGIRCLVAGPDWPEGPWTLFKNTWVPEDETFQIYHQAKFCLNFSLLDPELHQGRQLQQLSPRGFETAACFAIPCYEENDLNRPLCSELKAFLTFTNPTELALRILAQRDEAWPTNPLLINRQIILQRHTWGHRLIELGF